MRTELFTLPEDFGIGSTDTHIHFYSNDKSSVKNKVVFTRNMFCLLQHGVKEVQTVTRKEVVTNKQILILTCGSTLMSESVAENGRYEAILIFFGNETLIDFWVKRGQPVPKEAQSNEIYKIDRDAFLDNFCQSLHLLRTQNNSEIKELKVKEILTYISLRHPEIFHHFLSQALSSKTDIKLKQVVELNSNRGLTIEELAFLCDMSVSSFKRHFSNLYHMSPQRYFTRQKMEHARRLLALQKRPSEIYAELGYANLSAFSNEFKKHFGTSPSHFQA